MIGKEQISQFQELYKEQFGKELSSEEALEQSTKLIRLMELVYKPMTEAEYKKYSST